jgi:long-chain acyl-CoA synthetase
MNRPEPPIEFSSLARLVDAAAERYGNKVLWQSLDDGTALSFAGFASDTTRCANALRRLGVERGTHVALMLPNVPAFAIAWIALARIGAVAVPVNMQYTSRELEYVLSDSRSAFLVIDEACLNVLDGIDNPIVPRSRVIVHGRAGAQGALDWGRIMRDGSAAPVADLPDLTDALMNIQYTSGTTGFPKGCMLSQDYWLVLGGVRSIQGPTPRRVLLDKPLSYMGGIWRLMVCLYTGATAYVARRFTLSGLQKRIVENRIDFFSVTDPVAALPSDPDLERLPIAWISASGLSKDLHRAIEQKFNAPVREMYGMTETGSTIFMPFEDGAMSGSGSCGLPAPFRQCRIVDPEGRDVASGKVGELWVKGRAILEGYFNKEDATRAAFSGDWFRTGDLFRQDAAGYFYIEGRIKDSIRRSGENISTRDVESVLASIPGVMEAAVIGVPDEFRGEEVKAFVRLEPGLSSGDMNPGAVISFCESRLAAFKVPRYIEYVTDFPRTTSGKIAKQQMKGAEKASGGAIFDRVKNQWI